MSLLSAVTPRNDAFSGGTYAPASDPRAVGGTFGGPGSAASLPDVPASQILSARNNSGSNVRVPYARLVPLRAKTTDGPGAEGVDWKGIPGLNTRANHDMQGRIIQNETDGLESGELAWILGRRYGGSGSFDESGRMTGASASASAHGLGMGYGVDRMQRLAYTSWVEAFFRASHGATAIRLDKLPITNVFALGQSHQIRSHAALLAGASVLASVDVPHVVNKTFPELGYVAGANGDTPYQYVTDAAAYAANPLDGVGAGGDVHGDGGLACGIFVMEEGPFLRGKTVEDMPVSMVAPNLRADGNGKAISHTVPRNLGDEVAFEALYAEMRKLAIFDWVPDGMVLSKLESPSGDPMSSSELDARQAQLFNIAIQGPAIAKTWTGDPLQQTMPMDRVFMCVVATVQSEFSELPADVKSGGDLSVAAGATKYAALINAVKGDDTDAEINARGELEAAIALGGKTTRADDNEIGKLAQKMKAAFANAGVKTKGTTTGGFGLEEEAAFAKLDVTDWRAKAALLRNGSRGVKKSTMCNFRLMRATSSYLSQYSRWRTMPAPETGDAKATKVDPKSRCGLRLGLDGTTATAEYIVGAWCIGTVLDNAASRSTVGHLVRIAPASMAINVSVNIEWWSGDKLYRHYMDTDSAAGGATVQTRSERTPGGEEPEAVLARQKRLAGVEVPKADIAEPVAWKWKK